jgi:hypothetical protein
VPKEQKRKAMTLVQTILAIGKTSADALGRMDFRDVSDLWVRWKEAPQPCNLAFSAGTRRREYCYY